MQTTPELDRLKITVIAEDSVLYESPYLGQHGVSFLVTAERDGACSNVLVDVAQNPTALLENMRLMQIDPASIDAIVLTHCHYDHTQGLAKVLKEIGREDIPVIAHPDIFRLNFINDPFLRHVGVVAADSREKIEACGGRLYLTKDPLQIMPGLTTSGEVARTNDFEEAGMSLFTIADGKVVGDAMRDDIALIANVRDSGLVIVTGCSHAGIVNIANQAVKLTGMQKLHGIIGGFHLIESTGDADIRIKKTTEALDKMNPDWICAGHCTGFRAQVALHKTFKDRFAPLHTGMIFTVPQAGGKFI